ncbi:MAG: glycosyltransferase family 4 protein [Candidatus Kaiserbacteria bacterium]|nr:glycosyltransferase family 4 protein [Candidatus Kaiserbacteria bacterium]
MRILIVSGIFEPDIGGPATYAPRLAAKLTELGHDVQLVTYSDKPQYDADARYRFKLERVLRRGKIANRIKMFFAVRRAARQCDIVYLLDWFAAGFPASLAADLAGKKYVVRIGGDYLWERYLSSGAPPLPLADFYAKGLYRAAQYGPHRYMIGRVLRKAARVIFNTEKQRELYERYMGVGGAAVIRNPIPRTETAEIHRSTASKEFVFWGRIVAMKNLSSLIKAFATAKIPQDFTLAIIGDGPKKAGLEHLARELNVNDRMNFFPAMPLSGVLERVKDARAFVLPSWTDISPNQVYEALAIGLPALVTSENYLSIGSRLPVTIDPRSVGDIAAKIEMLADDTQYASFAERFASIRESRDWKDVADEHVRIFETL